MKDEQPTTATYYRHAKTNSPNQNIHHHKTCIFRVDNHSIKIGINQETNELRVKKYTFKMDSFVVLAESDE